MGATRTRVKYNIRLESLSDIKPETLVDSDGQLQSDHNRLNTIARNKLSIVERVTRGNQVKISEVEKLAIKQQTEIDFIKSTPTNFDLARVELFQNLFGTVRPTIPDGVPDSEILTDLFEPRSDGNFEYGVLKNPRTKYLGGVDKIINLNSLFGTNIKDIAYGEITDSLWIVTSDGQGQRGYLFRCSTKFIDGQVNVLSYWQLNALGGTREHIGVCESQYNGVTTLFVGVSDESGAGAHFLNRYRIRFNEKENIVTIADGKESSPLVPIYKGNGEILDGEVSSSIADLNVERIDISDPGKLRGLEVVNNLLYIVVQEDSSASEEEIDNSFYSFIRRVTITDFGVLTSGTNTFKFKFDDIFENNLSSDNSPTRWNIFGIAPYRITTATQAFSNVSQSNVTSSFNQNNDKNLFWLGAQNETTNEKRIVLIDLTFADTTTASVNYNTGLQNINTFIREFSGYSNNETAPFITTLLNRTLLEIHEKVSTTDRKILAIHEIGGYDLFQGNTDKTYKVKRYFNTENFHSQLAVNINAIAVNQTQAVTAGPDNEFQFVTAGGSRSRLETAGSPTTFLTGHGANLLHLHSYLNNDPYFVKPDKTFALTDGVDNPISGIISLAWEGNPVSGDALYSAYIDNSENIALLKTTASDITSAAVQIGADGFTQYSIVTGTPVTLTDGTAGSFNGHVSFDPVTSKLWVSTDKGFIHNVTDGGNTLDFGSDTYKVIKVYGSSSSGEVTDGSRIIGLSVYDDVAYVASLIPDDNGLEPANTIVRVFDISRSTSTQPLSTSIFATKGIVSDINISDNGLYTAKNNSVVNKIHESQFGNNVFESTEVFDEFNFFKNPVLNTGEAGQLGFTVNDTQFIEKTKSSDSFQKREWILPRRAMAFALEAGSSNTTNPGQLKIVDFSDIDNPVEWTEFNISFATGGGVDTNPALPGMSGAILHGSGQIDSLTFVDDKLFVGRRDYGIGTSINVIDFANDSSTLILDPILGQGSQFSGLQFGYKNFEEDKTGGLNQRNDSEFHYSGFVNPNVKVGPGIINSMDSARVKNTTDQNVLTPYVIVGRDVVDGFTSGGVDIINGNTLESVIGIGPGTGPIQKVAINSDGSAFAATKSGVIYKIDDVTLVGEDGANYTEDFSSQSITIFYPNLNQANGLTDMKVRNFTDTLGNSRNIVYVSYDEGSGNPSYVAKFTYEDVAEAGGGFASEFLNNAEVIYFDETSDRGVQAVDFMDDRVFLAFNDPAHRFRMTVLKKMNFQESDSSPYANNWTPVLGKNGAADGHIDYVDLNYNGIKSPITSLDSIGRMSLMFANTPNGTVLFKFPFVGSSKWFSTTKPITPEINAVALARDVYIEDGFVTEFIDRNDSRIKFEGSWTDTAPATIAAYTAPLFNKPVNRKQMRGKVVINGSVLDADSFENYDPFSEAPGAGFDILWDGSSITNEGFDFNENVLKIKKDNGVFVFDLVNAQPGNVDYKPTYKGKDLAYVSFNDRNSAIYFFETRSGEVNNLNPDSYGLLRQTFNISQNPVVAIQTLDGRPISTFQEASKTGEATGQEEEDIIKNDLSSTQKLITDPDGNPVNTIVITGNKAKSEGKFASKVQISTFNFAITERI